MRVWASGWAGAELAALGVPFHKRGVLTNEYLAIRQACWAPGQATFHGRFMRDVAPGVER